MNAMTEARFCEHIIFLAHAPLRVYDKSGVRRAVYVDHGEQTDILEADPAFEKMLLEKKREEFPILYTEQAHIAYGIIAGKERDYILGPCCMDGRPSATVRFLKEKHGLDAGTPYRIGYIDQYELSELIVMLYEMVTGNLFDKNQLMIVSFLDKEMEQNLGRQRHRVFHERQEEAVLHNPYSQELREQGSIKRGDLEGLHKSFRESYAGKVGRVAADELRNIKDLAIAVISVSCRSAIEGGVLPEIAFSVSDAYIRQVEETKNVGEATAVSRKAEIDFCRMVQEEQRYGRQCGKRQGKQSTVVVRCRELVLKYLHTKLSAKDLAAELEVTPGYLSQIFAKEEGKTLTDYIADEKIKFAKEQLIYTEDSYELIAYTYGFSSQSHFGSVFKKRTGMTPGEFREHYRAKEL